MSEHDDNTFRVATVIYLLVLTVAFIVVTKLDASEIRDLQRRVGAIESREGR